MHDVEPVVRVPPNETYEFTELVSVYARRHHVAHKKRFDPLFDDEAFVCLLAGFSNDALDIELGTDSLYFDHARSRYELWNAHVRLIVSCAQLLFGDGHFNGRQAYAGESVVLGQGERGEVFTTRGFEKVAVFAIRPRSKSWASCIGC